MQLNVLLRATFFFIKTSLRFKSQTPNEDGKTRCKLACRTKYNVACKPPFKFKNPLNEMCVVRSQRHLTVRNFILYLLSSH